MKAIREATPQARHHFTLADQVHQLVSGPVKRTPIWVSWRGSPLLTFLPSLAAVLLLAAGSLPLQAQGSTTYYFPHLAVGASWQTTITYINYSPEEVTCQTDFISDHGTPLLVSFAALGTVVRRTDVLPPGGLRSPGDQRGPERFSCARLGAGQLLGAGEGQPSVSSAQ